MFDEPFARGPSPLHRLDPRVRVGAAVLLSVVLACLRTPQAAALGLLGALALTALGRPPWRPLLRRVLAVNAFLAFLWVVTPLTAGGETLTVWGLELSRRGVALSLLATLKSNAVFLVFLSLACTMATPTLGYALERLRVPSSLAFLFLFTYRYAHVLAEEWRVLRTAARLRGFRPRTDRHTYRHLGYLLGMVLVRAWDRSQRVHEAMLLRGFDGRFRSATRFTAAPRDARFAVLTALALLCLLFVDFFPEYFRG